MKLKIEDAVLRIRLNPLETVASFRHALDVPLDRIIRASAEKPAAEWGQVRCPGTHIPFLLKAGTYTGGGDREFWMTTAGRPYLVIELHGWDFRRIVLTTGESAAWAERLNRGGQ